MQSYIPQMIIYFMFKINTILYAYYITHYVMHNSKISFIVNILIYKCIFTSVTDKHTEKQDCNSLLFEECSQYLDSYTSIWNKANEAKIILTFLTKNLNMPCSIVIEHLHFFQFEYKNRQH